METDVVSLGTMTKHMFSYDAADDDYPDVEDEMDDDTN